MFQGPWSLSQPRFSWDIWYILAFVQSWQPHILLEHGLSSTTGSKDTSGCIIIAVTFESSFQCQSETAVCWDSCCFCSLHLIPLQDQNSDHTPQSQITLCVLLMSRFHPLCKWFVYKDCGNKVLSYGALMNKILWEREIFKMRNNLSLKVKILVKENRGLEVYRSYGWKERKKEIKIPVQFLVVCGQFN